MILTGPEIVSANADGRLRIEPFADAQVNPNSYNVRLGESMSVYTSPVIDAYSDNATQTITLPPEGYVLKPNTLYLGHTVERVGSERYVPLLFGRSSVGRLGLFVEITAPIGDIGFFGQWTLMLTSIHELRIYPGMKIGQIMFFESKGIVAPYSGKYQGSVGPQRSKYWQDVRAG